MTTSTPAPILYNLYIYTNDECNLACKHCWVTAKLSNEVKNRYVSLEQYIGLIEEAAPLGLGYIKISGGEALLSRDEVLGIVRTAHKHRIAVRLETNGTLIDDDLALQFKQTGAAVSVSLDGSTAAIHEAIRLVPDSFDATMKGLNILSRHEVPIEVIMSVCRENAEDLPNVVALVSKLKNARMKINPILTSGRGQKMGRKDDLMDAQELLEFVRSIETRYGQMGVPILVSSEPAFHSLRYITQQLVSGGKCGFKNLIAVLANGQLSFCNMGKRATQYNFGHISTVSLRDVWENHPTLQAVRRQVPDQLEGICGNCMLKTTCQGACRSHAFEKYGSITAPSPGCQALFDAGLFPKDRLIDPSRDASYVPLTANQPVLNVLN